MMTGFRWLVGLGLAMAATLACSATLTVSAAASLREAFMEIGVAFERTHAPHQVQFNFGASGQLLQQITRGAPVDVFATADLETMDRAEKANLIFRQTRRSFARNQLVVVVLPDAQTFPKALEDLRRPEFARIAIGDPETVPAGRYARATLEAAQLWTTLRPKLVYSRNLRQALDYVARGEADAGVVHLSDALNMQERVRVAIPLPTTSPILYPIAAIKGWGNEALSRQFIDFVLSDDAQRILSKYHFEKP
jgi:molybdate transport system substrate-binding protein